MRRRRDAQRDGSWRKERAGWSRLQPPMQFGRGSCLGPSKENTARAALGQPRPRCERPPPSQPPLPPPSWRALRSPGPFPSSHVSDIIAGCHGKARLSKTRPLGLIPCVSGNEGFIAHLCNGAETAGAGTAARGRANNPPSSRAARRATPWWPLRWGNGDLFRGVARLIYVS